MYTLYQLLVRNFMFAISFSIISFIVITAVVVSQVKQHQQQHAATFTHFNQLTMSAEQLIETLKTKTNSDTYYRFSLTQNNQEQFFYQQPITSLLNDVLVAPTSQIKFEQQDVILNYQLSVNAFANLLMIIFATIFLLSLIFIVIAAKLSLKRYSHLANKINSQVKQDLAAIISEESTDTTKPDHDIDLPEIQAHLTELKALLASKISATTVLEKSAYLEPITQLENRNRFIQFFEHDQERAEFGVLMITRCSELQTINQIHGYHEGDNYVKNVADIMKSAISRYKGAKVFRLNSSDFATIIPNITLKSAETFANDLTGSFNQYQQSADLDSVGYTGMVAYDKDKPLGELLALADTGISIAQTQQVNAWFAQDDEDILENNSASYGNQNWRQEIDNVIENQRINLLLQPIKPTASHNKVYGEVLARFLNSTSDTLPTASFFAMAEKLDKIVAVDRLVIETAINEITQKNLQDHFFGINISARSINDNQFLVWLERRLLRDTAIAAKLIFEITEYGLQQNLKTSKRFVDMIHRVGARVTVERFGVGLTSFKFFRDLKPDFIKMDSTYTRDIDEDKNNQYFLRLMVDLAHRLSITVLAESVENQEEKYTLEKLFIDGCQGFYIGKPRPL